MKKTILIAIAMLSVMLTGCVSPSSTESSIRLAIDCATLKERLRFVVEDLPQFTDVDTSTWVREVSTMYGHVCSDITGELPEVLLTL